MADYLKLYPAKSIFFSVLLADYKKSYPAKTGDVPKEYLMEKLVGRVKEKEILENALTSPSAELVAIYGRRRVGKTFLIRSVYEKKLVFEFTGVHNATMQEQLTAFSFALKNAMDSPIDLAVPANWGTAFNYLEKFLTANIKKKEQVIFFDEFPWIHTQKSNFLKAFEHFWNSCASRNSNLTVVICGSAASWMINNIVNNKGGLHNRVSIRIKLMPFSLPETRSYLKSRAVNLDNYQILQIYMAMGGIPQYLKAVQPGKSAIQLIDEVFFSRYGQLKDEFNNLFESLFDNPAHHVEVIRVLTGKRKGITRNEIIASLNLSSGGTLTKVLTELEESGFITPYIPFEKTSKEVIYRLTDEYSLFYLKFIDKSRATGPGTWHRISDSSSWKSWSGYAFEGICLKHILQIRKALGISAIYTEESVWRHIPGKAQAGAQIDLLLDRADHCINICELKFSVNEFAIDKKYAEELMQKRAVFIDATRTKKTIFLAMITTYGVLKNSNYNNLIQNEVTMNALFNNIDQ